MKDVTPTADMMSGKDVERDFVVILSMDVSNSVISGGFLPIANNSSVGVHSFSDLSRSSFVIPNPSV